MSESIDRRKGATDAGNRRNFLLGGLFALILGALGFKTGRADDTASEKGLVTQGEVLKTRVRQGRPPVEPLDTMVLFERSDNNTGRAMTHEILSLIHEEKGNRSYPWTIYSHLTTHHVEGDACILCSRLTKNGAGWSTGLHSEVYCNARAVALGVNVEMTNNYAGPEKSEVIGVNVQILPGQECQYGMQIHGEGRVRKAIALNGNGASGLDVSGNYDIGVNAGPNSIRLNEGSCLELDEKGTVKIRYQNGRIEFLNGEKCVAHIRMDGEDREI